MTFFRKSKLFYLLLIFLNYQNKFVLYSEFLIIKASIKAAFEEEKIKNLNINFVYICFFKDRQKFLWKSTGIFFFYGRYIDFNLRISFPATTFFCSFLMKECEYVIKWEWSQLKIWFCLVFVDELISHIQISQPIKYPLVSLVRV